MIQIQVSNRNYFMHENIEVDMKKVKNYCQYIIYRNDNRRIITITVMEYYFGLII